jgi:hypothetical protein
MEYRWINCEPLSLPSMKAAFPPARGVCVARSLQ